MSASGGLGVSAVEALEAARSACGVPAVTIAVVRPNRPVVVTALGSSGVDGGTLFPIASCTKAFTSTLVATYVDDGVLAWDTPVREYLADFKMHDPAATDQLTVRDMLAHRSGLPRHDTVWFRNTASSRADIVRALRHLEPSQPFRAAWQYNNLMYLAAGWLVETVSGTSWEQALRERILDPLGMTSTAPAVSGLPTGAPIAPGYVRTSGRVQTMPFGDHELGGPAGSMVSCADDLATWIGSCLEGTVVSEQSARELRKPTMVLPPPVVRWPELTKTSYALGWDLIQYRGRSVLQHGGNTEGYSSMVTLLPEEGIGIAVLCNLHITPMRDIASWVVLDELLGLDPRPWTDRFRDLYDASQDDLVPSARRRRDRSVGAPWTRPLEEYVSKYVHPAYGTVTVEVVDGELSIRLRDDDLQTSHAHHDSFELHDDVRAASVLGSFGADVRGHLRTIALGLEPAVAPIEFVREAPPYSGALSPLIGRFSRGPLSAEVSRTKDGGLQLAMPPDAPVVLEHRQGLQFGLGGSAQATVEFTLGADGAANTLDVWPTGEFVRVTD